MTNRFLYSRGSMNITNNIFIFLRKIIPLHIFILKIYFYENNKTFSNCISTFDFIE